MRTLIFAAIACLASQLSAAPINRAHWYFHQPPTPDGNVFLETEYDFTLDHANKVVSINSWVSRDLDGNVIYSVPQVTDLMLENLDSNNTWEATLPEGLLKFIPQGLVPNEEPTAWQVAWFPSDPKPTTNAVLLAGQPAIVPWELQSIVVQTPEPATWLLAVCGLVACAWRRINTQSADS